jgi:hypothetical protein
MSTLYVDTITEKTSGNGVQIPGHVVQVVSVAKTDTFSVSNSTFADVTGLSVTITPKASTNKILVLTHLHLDALVGGYTHPWRLMRDSTPIAVGDAAGSRRQASGGGTSVYRCAFNYKCNYLQGATCYLHRCCGYGLYKQRIH